MYFSKVTAQFTGAPPHQNHTTMITNTTKAFPFSVFQYKKSTIKRTKSSKPKLLLLRSRMSLKVKFLKSSDEKYHTRFYSKITPQTVY